MFAVKQHGRDCYSIGCLSLLREVREIASQQGVNPHKEIPLRMLVEHLAQSPIVMPYFFAAHAPAEIIFYI